MTQIRPLVGWKRGEECAWPSPATLYRQYSDDVPDLFILGVGPVSASREDATTYALTDGDIDEWHRCEKHSEAQRDAFKEREHAANRGWLLASKAYGAVTDVLDAYWNSLHQGG